MRKGDLNMTISNNVNDLKCYFKEIKTLMPLNGKPEKRFLSDLDLSLKEYTRESPNYDIYEIYEKFGTPLDIVTNYFETINTRRLAKRIRLTQFMRILLILILCIALVFSVYRGIIIYKSYLTVQKQVVTHFDETIIEE